MTFSEFTTIAQSYPDDTVMLEGRRVIPMSDYINATRFARNLALRFRSGNAKESDRAFSEGVAQVDASRLQIVAPYASHRKSIRYTNAI